MRTHLKIFYKLYSKLHYYLKQITHCQNPLIPQSLNFSAAASLTLAALFSLTTSVTNAQNDKPLVRKGNKLYEGKKYADAETQYRKGLEKNKDSYEGAFNLGGALYKQDKFDEATGYYHNIIQKGGDDKTLANAYYNLGNALLKSEKYEESVNAYKNALKKNPESEDTRYNMSYALQKLRQQQQQQQQNKDDKKKEKKEDKKQDQKQDEKKEEQKKQEQQQPQQKQEQKLSKEEAERILQALKNDEKKLQKNLQKKEGVRANIEKQW